MAIRIDVEVYDNEKLSLVEEDRTGSNYNIGCFRQILMCKLLKSSWMMPSVGHLWASSHCNLPICTHFHHKNSLSAGTTDVSITLIVNRSRCSYIDGFMKYSISISMNLHWPSGLKSQSINHLSSPFRQY